MIEKTFENYCFIRFSNIFRIFKDKSLFLFRNAFSVIANITIYVALFVLLRNDTNSEDVNPTDMIYFRVSPLVHVHYHVSV